MKKQIADGRGISRRDTLALAGAGAATALTGTLPRRGRAQNGTVAVGTWGGSYTEAQTVAFFEPFTEATGIEVEIVTGGNLTAGTIKAFVETGYYEWDWTTLGASEYATAVRNGWLEPVNYTLVTEEGKTPDTQFLEFAVGAETISDVLTYRTDAFPDGGPASWADFWNIEAFPGTRAMFKSPYPILEAALLADGVSAEELYPLDLDRAFAKADELKDEITVWWESGTQSQDIVINRNAVMAGLWNGRAAQLKRDGVPVELAWNGALYEPVMFAVPMGAPNKDNAMRLNDFASSAEPLARFAELTFYGPSNLKAIDLVDPTLRPLMNTAPENFAQSVHRDFSWWAENMEKVNERFVAWLIS